MLLKKPRMQTKVSMKIGACPREARACCTRLILATFAVVSKYVILVFDRMMVMPAFSNPSGHSL